MVYWPSCSRVLLIRRWSDRFYLGTPTPGETFVRGRLSPPRERLRYTLRGCEEIDLSDIAGNPSPRPSPRGRGRPVSVTCQCIFFVAWVIHVQVDRKSTRLNSVTRSSRMPSSA